MKCTECRESTSYVRTYLLDRIHYLSVTECVSRPLAGAFGCGFAAENNSL